jgi:hypothetical protein
MVMAWAVAALAGCRATDFLNDVGKEHLDLGRMEADIRSGLQRRLEIGSRSTSASVTSVSRVRCRERSELAATCVARVVERDGRRRVRIEVTVNPETGDYTWEVVS